MDERERFQKGMEVRRAVLGDAYVDKAMARRGPFAEPLQDLITRYAWGEIWSRPGLSRPARSMVTVAVLAALGRLEELRGHVRGALNNGVSRDELREVLLQVAVYAGVPASNSAFRLAEEVLAQIDGEPAP